MSFVFGTKGETLARLKPLLSIPALCDQEIFTVAEWRRDGARLLQQIQRRFANLKLAVRSCAQDEDGWAGSMAGAYTSLIGVANEPAAVGAAIAEVLASYREQRDDNQVLVQPMVDDVVISGVLMTRELNTGSPYYSINYDDFSGRTDSVTSGAASKAFLVRRAHTESVRSPRFRKLLEAVQEIERATGVSRLDIEFCISRTDEVYILQVRPMAVERRWAKLRDQDIDHVLELASSQVERLMVRQAGLFGDTTVLGEMPDWNPAEMLGSHPRPLAISLYKRLITDGTWAQARAQMGYRDVGNISLLVEVAGRPYIDVRKSLNSFLPADISESFGERLVNHQLDRLRGNPHLHDKIEFNIAVTCADFSLPVRLQQLEDAGFARTDIDAFGQSLRALTAEILKNPKAHLGGLQGKVASLKGSRERAAALGAKEGALSLLADCVRSGTLPFACAARHGFIAVSLLRSLVAREALTEEDAARFLRSVHTVAADVVHDLQDVGRGVLDKDVFLARHGHLRPGTYDVLSHRYDELPDLYLGHTKATHRMDTGAFALSASQKGAVERLLREFGYACGADELFAYMTQSIALRESAKYEFTKNVSDALESLRRWGEGLGLSRSELAYLTIEQIDAGENDWAALAAAAQKHHELTGAVRLPHLLVSRSDINVVRLPLGQSNFITRKQVTAPVKVLIVESGAEVDGKIVLIESADPGFDWIFSHDIRGLITKFGGANSHMAIRCAEFDLPAAIGCGERLFDMAAQAHVVELNCSSRTIRVVR